MFKAIDRKTLSYLLDLSVISIVRYILSKIRVTRSRDYDPVSRRNDESNNTITLTYIIRLCSHILISNQSSLIEKRKKKEKRVNFLSFIHIHI